MQVVLPTCNVFTILEYKDNKHKVLLFLKYNLTLLTFQIVKNI